MVLTNATVAEVFSCKEKKNAREQWKERKMDVERDRLESETHGALRPEKASKWGPLYSSNQARNRRPGR